MSAMGERHTAIVQEAQRMYNEVDMVTLKGSEKPRSQNLIVLAETEQSVFTQISQVELAQLQELLRNAQSVLWVTNGNLLHGERPDQNMINGILSAVKIEMPTLKFATIDLDSPAAAESKEFLALLNQTSRRLCSKEKSYFDTQVRLSNGIPFIGRIMLEESLNLKQAVALGHSSSSSTGSASLSELKDEHLQMVLSSPGIADSLLLKVIDEKNDALGSNEVELDIEATCLSPQVRS